MVNIRYRESGNWNILFLSWSIPLVPRMHSATPNGLNYGHPGSWQLAQLKPWSPGMFEPTSNNIRIESLLDLRGGYHNFTKTSFLVWSITSWTLHPVQRKTQTQSKASYEDSIYIYIVQIQLVLWVLIVCACACVFGKGISICEFSHYQNMEAHDTSWCSDQCTVAVR